MRVTKRLVLLAAASMVACGDGLGPEEESEPIQTEDRTYELVHDTLVILGERFPYLSTEINYRYTNRTGEPIYIVRCEAPHVIVERLMGGDRWVPYWSAGWNDCLGAPITIQPGAHYDGALEFGGVEYGVEGFDPSFPEPDLDGTYRLTIQDVVKLQAPGQYPDGTELPLEERTSNAFAVTVR